MADEPAARYHFARHIQKTVGSAASFKLVRTWIDECDKTHNFCALPSQDMLPLRVIEICWKEGCREPKIRLVATPRKALYAALSYCWGDPKIMKKAMLISQIRQAWFENIPF